MFYDGQSPSCAKAIDLLKSLDWKNRIHFESFRNSQLLRLNKISEEKAEKRIVSISLAKNQKLRDLYVAENGLSHPCIMGNGPIHCTQHLAWLWAACLRLFCEKTVHSFCRTSHPSRYRSTKDHLIIEKHDLQSAEGHAFIIRDI